MKKSLKKVAIAIKNLDRKYSFIGTIEAENITDVLIKIAQKRGLAIEQAIALIDSNREW